MTAVYKRELRSYFTSMVGYVFIAILIFFVGIYFMAYNLFGGYPSFGYVLLSCTIIFMVTVPILTMRSMAEDRRGKTDQLLLTSPVSLTGIVLGKYLAMVTVLLVPILLICFCPLIIAMNGSATLTADYAAILAFFCMGCVYIAVGMFVSALTESQIIAAVGTFAALLVLYLWTDLVSFLPDSLAQLLSSFDFQGVLLQRVRSGGTAALSVHGGRLRLPHRAGPPAPEGDHLRRYHCGGAGHRRGGQPGGGAAAL